MKILDVFSFYKQLPASRHHLRPRPVSIFNVLGIIHYSPCNRHLHPFLATVGVKETCAFSIPEVLSLSFSPGDAA